MLRIQLHYLTLCIGLSYFYNDNYNVLYTGQPGADTQSSGNGRSDDRTSQSFTSVEGRE